MQQNPSQNVEETAIPPSIQSPEDRFPAPADGLLLPGQPKIEEISALVKRLRHSRLIRQIGSPIALHSACTDEMLELLIETLCNPSEKRWRERVVAAWILGQAQLNPNEKAKTIEALSDVLVSGELSQGVRFITRIVRGTARSVLLALTLSLVVLSLIAYSDVSLIRDAPYVELWQQALIMLGALTVGFLFFAAPIAIPISLMIDNARANRVRAAAATSLGLLRVPDSVDGLAKAVVDRSPRVYKAAGPALRAVLPTLTPEHYGQLASETIPNLCRTLDSLIVTPADEKLALSILAALEVVGDGRAVPTVQRLAHRGPSVPVQEVAEYILPTLVERQRRENERAVLLRASAASTPPDTLLRPASAHIDPTPSEQLLRPQAPQ